jgi:hypothetical protein
VGGGDGLVVLAHGAQPLLAVGREEVGTPPLPAPVAVAELRHEVVLVRPVVPSLEGGRARREVERRRNPGDGAQSRRQPVALPAEHEERDVRAQRKAAHRHLRDDAAHRVHHRQEVRVEAGVVEARAEHLAVAGPAHVHAQDVPAARPGEAAGREQVRRLIGSGQAVEQDERGPRLARPRLPARADEDADVVPRVHHEVLGRECPGQPATVPVAEERLAMPAGEPRGGAEMAVRGKGHGATRL